ncbi:MAG TPA: GntR family transcriptional regulator [Acidimicrobiales bacterium]|nr:GntR family transcriptional regulator [Acidimicrobiales bacterium]
MERTEALITFRLDPRSGVPAYRQLVDQVRQAVLLGILRPGDRLPSVRDVVSQVSINPNTVHRAYRDLEMSGDVEGKQGLGTFVAETIPTGRRSAAPAAQAELIDELSAWVGRARSRGMTEEEIGALIANALGTEQSHNGAPGNGKESVR